MEGTTVGLPACLPACLVPSLPQQKHLPLILDLKPQHKGEERSLTATCRPVALPGDGTAVLLLFDSVRSCLWCSVMLQ